MFGVTYDIAPYVEILNAANIEIIEDCAQSWRSLEKFRGSDFATMTMFSFGLIKNNTAFYGAVSIVRQKNETHRAAGDQLLCQKIESRQSNYDLYMPENYNKKISSSWKIWMMLQTPLAVKLCGLYFKARGQDMEAELVKQLRGFPATDEPYLNKYRLRPCAPLIKMIIHQTKGYSNKEHKVKIENYHRMSVALSTNGVFIPGYLNFDRSYWLCPIVVPNRQLFKDFMRIQGIFCYVKATQICEVEMPLSKIEEGFKPALNCRSMFNNIVFLPVNFSIPRKEMDVMIKRVLGIVQRYQMMASLVAKAKN